MEVMAYEDMAWDGGYGLGWRLWPRMPGNENETNKLEPRSQAYPVLSVLRFPLTIMSVYYCQRKPKNRKNGVGLGTRLRTPRLRKCQ